MRQRLKELKKDERQKIVEAIRAITPVVECKELGSLIGFVNTLEPTKRSLQRFFSDLHLALEQHREPGALRSFLQKIVLNLFIGVNQISLYEQLIPFQNENLLELLKTSRKWLHEQGAIKKGYNLRYIFQQPGQLLKIFKGMRLGAFFLNWVAPYDPRRTENYPTHLFDEELPRGRAIYVATPTPTIGNEVRPEALALLETIVEGEIRPRLRGWIYVNLQHRQKWQEMFRSKNIMQLNEKFSEQFFGCTLDVNSNFYRHHTVTTHEELIQWLLDDQVIESDGLSATYLPIPRQEWPQWRAQALSKLRELPLEVGSTALKEMALLVMYRQFQEYVFKRLPQGSEVITTVACKECIDRGGKMNAEILWSSPYINLAEKNRMVAAIFFGRALFARNRMVQPHRSDAFLELLERVPNCKIPKI